MSLKMGFKSWAGGGTGSGMKHTTVDGFMTPTFQVHPALKTSEVSSLLGSRLLGGGRHRTGTLLVTELLGDKLDVWE